MRLAECWRWPVTKSSTFRRSISSESVRILLELSGDYILYDKLLMAFLIGQFSIVYSNKNSSEPNGNRQRNDNFYSFSIYYYFSYKVITHSARFGGERHFHSPIKNSRHERRYCERRTERHTRARESKCAKQQTSAIIKTRPAAAVPLSKG